MHLVVALRHGLELPSTLPAVLLPGKKETGGNLNTVQDLHSDSSDMSTTQIEKCNTVYISWKVCGDLVMCAQYLNLHDLGIVPDLLLFICNDDISPYLQYFLAAR